jgi:hypothetical protein
VTRPTEILVEHEGQQVSLKQLAALCGANYWTLWQRYHRGLRGEALTQPGRILVEHEGAGITLQQLSGITGVSIHTLYWRHRHGMRGAALARPVVSRPAQTDPPVLARSA